VSFKIAIAWQLLRPASLGAELANVGDAHILGDKSPIGPYEPPIGTFQRRSGAGNSTPNVSLVAGISNWLTVDKEQR